MKPLIIRSLNLLILSGKLLFKGIFFQMKIIFNFTHVMAVVFCKVRLKKLERNINYKERERERKNDVFTFFFRTFVEKFLSATECQLL